MIYAALIYASAMTMANLSVTTFGPAVSPINSFLFIGLDLTLRDWLQVRLSASKMFGLIALSGAITYLLNPSAGPVAVASAVSFTASALVDWSVFSRSSGSWIRRSNTSNAAGAAVDSVVFPALAFGALIPGIVLAQLIAKVLGGALWSYVITKLTSRQLGATA